MIPNIQTVSLGTEFGAKKNKDSWERLKGRPQRCSDVNIIRVSEITRRERRVEANVRLWKIYGYISTMFGITYLLAFPKN